MQFNPYFILGAALILMALSGCSTSKPVDVGNHEIGQMLDQEVGTLDPTLVARIMAEVPHLKTKSQAKVEGEINRRIRWWMHYYSVRERESFTRGLERGENYRPVVQQILNQHQLPPELYYLALIESSFVTHATSATSAVGIWQFMRPTAVNYGLNVDGVDERRHPIASTEAASRYLTDLHKEFNSWYLAISAYNAGPGRIRKALREGNTRDFWALAEGGFLPQETMDYIPKFLAAATIGSHLDQFGFQAVRANQSQAWPAVTSVAVKPRTKISQLVRQTLLSQKELIRLNPNLLYALNHATKKPVRVWLPKDSAIRLSHATVVAEEKSNSNSVTD